MPGEPEILARITDRELEIARCVAEGLSNIEIAAWLFLGEVVSQVGPVSRDSLEPSVVGHLPGYLMRKVADGVRLATGM